MELAELVADHGFRRRVREMALARAPRAAGRRAGARPAGRAEHAGAALAEGSPRTRRGPGDPRPADRPGHTPADRARLADRIETFTDRRVERYWQLLGVLSGAPPFPSAVPAYEWLIAALRAPR